MLKKLDHVEQRALISQCTAELIAEFGIEKVTFQAVALRMNCTKGKLFHYYSNKEDLINDSYAFVNDRLETRIAHSMTLATQDNWVDLLVENALPLTKDAEIEWTVRQNYWQHILVMPERRKEQIVLSEFRMEMIEAHIIGFMDQALLEDKAELINLIHNLYDMVFGLGINLLFYPIGEIRNQRVEPLKFFLQQLSNKGG